MTKTKKVNKSRSISRSRSRSTNKKKSSLKINKLYSLNAVPNKGISPKYEIIDGPGFAYIIFSLNKGETIVSNGGKMLYMNKNMKVNVTTQGFFKGIYRKLATSNNMYLTEYTGLVAKTDISFGNTLPGNIIPISVKPGQKISLATFSLICFTPNIYLETRKRAKGIFLGDKAFLTDVCVDINEKKNGIAWVSSYGGYKKISIKQGETFAVDNGIFVAADSNTRYTIGKVGNIKSFFFGGEGFVMNFKGPSELYIQNRNYNALKGFIKNNSKKKKNIYKTG
jgi:uncharacterized protein (TIGR00266 family)